MSAGVALRQRLQQRLGLLEVSGIKTFDEPVVDRGQHVVRCVALPLTLPEARETGSGSQLEGFCLLVAGEGERLMETVFGFGLMVCMLL